MVRYGTYNLNATILLLRLYFVHNIVVWLEGSKCHDIGHFCSLVMVGHGKVIIPRLDYSLPGSE